MVLIEAKPQEAIGESVCEFPELSKKIHYKDIKKKLSKGDKFVHNKLDSKRILKRTMAPAEERARTRLFSRTASIQND